MKYVAVVIVALIMAGCAAIPTLLPDAQSAAASLYTEKCGACHSVPHPQRNTAAEWMHLLAVMDQRSEERGMTALSPQEKKDIEDYLVHHAR